MLERKKYNSIEELWQDCKSFSTEDINEDNSSFGRSCFYAGAVAMLFGEVDITPEVVEEIANFIKEGNLK